MTLGTDVLDTPAAGGSAIRGGAIRLVGYALGVAVGIIAMAVLFRHIGVADAGKYVTVLAIVGIFVGVTDGGLSMIAVRELSAEESRKGDAFGAILGVRVASTAAGIVLAVLFAGIAGYGETIVIGTALTGMGFVLLMFQLTLAAPLMRDLRWGSVAALDLVRQFAAAAVIVGLAVAGASLTPFFAAPIVSGVLVIVATAVLVKGRIPILPPISFRGWGEVVRAALPFALAIAVAALYFRIAVILVSLLSTETETGYFGASYRIVEVLLAVPQLAISAAFPILARAAHGDRERFSYALGRLFDVSIVFGGWIALALLLGADLAIDVVAGPGFEPAADVLRIQGVALAASFVAALWGFALFSLHRHRALTVMSLVPLVVTGVATAILASAYGAKGAAVATAAGETIMALLGAYLVVRALGASPFRFGRSLRVSAAWGAAVAVWFVPGLSDAVRVTVATVIYLVALLLLKAIPKELLDELRRMRPAPR